MFPELANCALVFRVGVTVAKADDDGACLTHPRSWGCEHCRCEAVPVGVAEGEELGHGPPDVGIKPDALFHKRPDRRNVTGPGCVTRLPEVFLDGMRHEVRLARGFRLSFDFEPGVLSGIANVTHERASTGPDFRTLGCR